MDVRTCGVSFIVSIVNHGVRSGSCTCCRFFHSLLLLVPGKELLVDFFASLPGFGGLLEGVVTAEESGVSLEGDLRAPLVGAFVLIDAADAAAVVAGNGAGTDGAANSFDAGAVDKMLGSIGCVMAATAGGVAVLEIGLADNGLISAAAAAFPPVLAGTLSVVGNDREIPELLADPVFEGRAAEAPAAPAVAGVQLAGRRNDRIAAVADTVPERAAEAVFTLRTRLDNELAEALTGQILRPGTHLLVLTGILALRIPAGRRPSVFQIPGGHSSRPAAVTQTAPHCIAVFSFRRRFHCNQMPEAHTRNIRFPGHMSTVSFRVF